MLHTLAMLLTSYIMYKYSFGKVIEGCIQFFAGGLIFAIGMYLLSCLIIKFLTPFSCIGTLSFND